MASTKNEKDEKDDDEFTKLFTKYDGQWQFVEVLVCEFCEEKNCNRVVYRDELDDKLDEVKIGEGKINGKRYTKYCAFVWMKHGQVGSRMRLKIDDCVMELCNNSSNNIVC